MSKTVLYYYSSFSLAFQIFSWCTETLNKLYKIFRKIIVFPINVLKAQNWNTLFARLENYYRKYHFRPRDIAWANEIVIRWISPSFDYARCKRYRFVLAKNFPSNMLYIYGLRVSLSSHCSMETYLKERHYNHIRCFSKLTFFNCYKMTKEFFLSDLSWQRFKKKHAGANGKKVGFQCMYDQKRCKQGNIKTL